jgi:hypothetical protein
MSLLFVVLFLLAAAGLVLGLINPLWVRALSRKRVALVMGGAMLLFFVLFTITAPSRSEWVVENKVVPTLVPGLHAVSVSDRVGSPSDQFPGKTYKLETFVGDGREKVLFLGGSYDDVTVRLHGTVQTIGTYKGNATCGDNDTCYDFSNRKLYFAKAPNKGAPVTVNGYPQ